MFYKSIKSTLCAIIPRGGRLMVFVLNPSNFRSNGVPRGVRMPFALKISLFVLKL